MIRRDLDRARLDADIVVVVENDAGDQVRVRAAIREVENAVDRGPDARAAAIHREVLQDDAINGTRVGDGLHLNERTVRPEAVSSFVPMPVWVTPAR